MRSRACRSAGRRGARHGSSRNVVATLALFFALTGTAAATAKYLTASDPITSGDLAGSTYGTPVMAPGSVISGKISDGAVTHSVRPLEGELELFSRGSSASPSSYERRACVGRIGSCDDSILPRGSRRSASRGGLADAAKDGWAASAGGHRGESYGLSPQTRARPSLIRRRCRGGSVSQSPHSGRAQSGQ